MTDGDVRVIKAEQNLKAKAGTGQISSDKISSAEKVLEGSTDSIIQSAQESLRDLKATLELASNKSLDKDHLLAQVREPLMQLKSSAGMSNYDLIGELADIMFHFLEELTEIDDDAMAIIDAHHTTLVAILANRMEGDGGEHGKVLKAELQGVCKRYFEQRQ